MYYLIYNILLHLSLPIIGGLLLVKKRLQRGLKPRLGFLDPALRQLTEPVIWVHAVSLGEALAVIPLLRALKHTWPQGTLVVSTITETGKEVISTQLDGIARHCYAPLDFTWAVNRYVRGLNPSLYILMESEIWPNLLRRLHVDHVPVCLINGRVSSRSFSRYRLIPGFMRQVLGCVDLALVQTERDGERMRALGAPQEIVQVTGNMKFDQMPDQPNHTSVGLVTRTDLGLEPHERLWVAGSTHEGEEAEIIEVYRELVCVYPQLVLLLAPRHIERTPQIEQMLRRYGMSCLCRSRISSQEGKSNSPNGPRVIILDTRGELAGLYRLGVCGFVGGTLMPVGGHNLLEPAQCGKPVLFGPFIDHWRDIAQWLIDHGGGIQVQDRQGLADQMKKLLADPEKAGDIGRRAAAAVQQRRGVVALNLQKIRELVNLYDGFRKNHLRRTQSLSAASQSTVK